MSEQSRFLDKHTPPHIITLVIVTGAGALNMNIALPSLPGIATYFGVSYSYAQLLISAYLAATAAVQLIIGPLSDRFGRRPVLLACIGIFLVASLVCIFAPNFQILLVARLVQTVIVAGLVLSRAAVRDMHEPARAASLFGYITMGMAVVPMVGPAIGGVLDEMFGWQASFLVSLLFGCLAFGLVISDMGETNKHPSANFAAQFRAYPELIRSRRFWGYALSAAFTSGSFFAFLGGAPYVSVTHLGLSPSEVGFYFALTAVGYMAGNFISGRYTERFGINSMLLSGNVISALGMVASILTFAAGSNHPLAFFGYMIFIGFGNGISLPSANAGIVSVRPHLAGSAAGLGGALMIGGGAGLSVLSGAVLSPESGAYPILYIMLISAIAGALMALYVMHVARQVALEANEPARQ
ncbi:multidrug effflux MFS transporter [Hoeflea prorocentri]|uniref:Bcr/CflA family efflux transporter n=1 Tax=Hoeflea prorocentri TaxID=1922333 RepID=A0A9X3UF94_9HYPH|nr:multidrug effflux MFS transporter [Hoeflea prorocentri]MCY6380283.1 multidrug effflux MFS transporter [Hoeflea prorocentri]MDA5398083.1 multidrug effflux MFS transporter [Hoeflea prorocentri]